ncbi:Transient receptor potential cation channel subfamily A member 1 [Paramuricea clavata]|uniref:Transient receptor potential cation channel subfamily A member 1 n=1 Tax=Paramuricea clavata TaxID=317549 RepID=A0A7D9LBR8_PARCT|nr:Transient receptor potential cation channel subfamily A member 1 [Paramuricea clavata]
MEFTRTRCKDKHCDYCLTWNGPPMKGVSQPLPDPQRPMHYMDVSVTPTHTEGGEEREADDWQPRANITKMFNTESISLDQQDLITEFSDKFSGEWETEKPESCGIRKYLDKNKLSKKGKKADVLRKKQNDTIEKVIEETGSDYNSDTGINSDSDEDVILDEFGDDTSSESDEEVDQTADETADVESLPWVVRTRYGRHAGHWNLFQLK